MPVTRVKGELQPISRITSWESACLHFSKLLSFSPQEHDDSGGGSGGVRFNITENDAENNHQEAAGGGDDDDAGGEEKQRLHRRDTPHHLKNKRINNKQVDKEKVATIIAQALKKQGGEGDSNDGSSEVKPPSNWTSSDLNPSVGTDVGDGEADMELIVEASSSFDFGEIGFLGGFITRNCSLPGPNCGTLD